MDKAGRERAFKLEFEVIGAQSRIAAAAQRSVSEHWHRLHYCIGIPATVIAALAGAAALSQLAGPILAGALGLTAAVLTGLLSFLNPSERASRASDAVRSYVELEGDAAYFSNLHLYTKPDLDAALSVIEELRSRKQRVNDRADVPPRRAWNRAVEEYGNGAVYMNIRNHLQDEEYARLTAPPRRGADDPSALTPSSSSGALPEN